MAVLSQESTCESKEFKSENLVRGMCYLTSVRVWSTELSAYQDWNDLLMDPVVQVRYSKMLQEQSLSE